MEQRIQIEVSPAHTDELGHLNHVQTMEFLQNARLAFYDRCGLRGSGGEAVYGTVVVNINVNFRRECFLGDRLTIVTRPLSIGTKSFVMAQEILRPDGEVAIDGKVTSVVMDMATRSIVPVPPCLAGHFQDIP